MIQINSGFLDFNRTLVGMSYENILSTFALSPSLFGGSKKALSNLADENIIQYGQHYFLREVLKVKSDLLSYFPLQGLPFVQTVLRPTHPVHGTFLPPGIAKKYGLWIPPGQRKKLDGHGKHGWKGWAKGKHSKGHHKHHGGKSKGKKKY